MIIQEPLFPELDLGESERYHQQLVVDYARTAGVLEHGNRLFSVNNGAGFMFLRGQELRSAKISCARMGMAPGVPDLVWPVRQGRKAGLLIEMKRTDGGVESDRQKGWREYLVAQGYGAVRCAGSVDAIETLKRYQELGSELALNRLYRTAYERMAKARHWRWENGAALADWDDLAPSYRQAYLAAFRYLLHLEA